MNPLPSGTHIGVYSTAGQYAAVIIIWLTLFVSPGVAAGSPEFYPEPNPPWGERDAETVMQHPAGSRALAPVVEWEYHKTSDNRHPDGNEQQLMWLMNRARSNPTVEGIWLADIYDHYNSYLPRCRRMTEDIDYCYIAGALDDWGVDLALLQFEFAGYDTKPPAAFDVRLYRAAKSHSEYLIGIDSQNHTDQFNRIADENFSYRRARGNVFSYSWSPIYGHAAFNVDWGPDGDSGSGMQSPPGHRFAIMSIDGDYTNVGIAAVPVSKSATAVGPLVITGNYCEANTFAENHYNRFLVGTVWTDRDNDNLFDPGEGIGGVTVMPDHGTYYAKTSIAGGYALPITAPGTYEVTFGGSALNGEVVATVMVGNGSVLLDLVDDSYSTAPAGDAGDEDSSGGGGGCFIAAIPIDVTATKVIRTIISFCSVILIVFAAFHRLCVFYRVFNNKRRAPNGHTHFFNPHPYNCNSTAIRVYQVGKLFHIGDIIFMEFIIKIIRTKWVRD
jgi:hypothetical protein